MSGGYPDAISLFGDDAFRIRFCVGLSSLPNPFFDFWSEWDAKMEALCSSIASAILVNSWLWF